jgi:hypothetical protein
MGRRLTLIHADFLFLSAFICGNLRPKKIKVMPVGSITSPPAWLFFGIFTPGQPTTLYYTDFANFADFAAMIFAAAAICITFPRPLRIICTIRR